MATLVLQTAGAALGGVLGGPIGAAVGRAVGAVAGAVIDQRLFGRRGGNRAGPRLTTLAGLESSEGAAVPRVYGKARIGGQLIWATRFLEVATQTRTGSSGGKGGGGAKQTTYTYHANFAVGLCEGPIAQVRRVWADGKELDLTTVTMRLYHGDDTQAPDPLIVAKEGAACAPAYHGLAYAVFDNIPIADYGNRIPQLSFEIVKPIAGLGAMIRAVDLIPGATEYGYAPGLVLQQAGAGVTLSENRHQLFSASDWSASLDALQAVCPNLVSVALVVAWFGDDLRAGACTIAPRVESAAKETPGFTWGVAGLTRASARVVSSVAGKPAYGGTPSDAIVLQAIADLKGRGLSVVLYPFVMMDVAAGNASPDPWTGAPSQPAYPWRGRISCDPAPGQPGSPDATPAAQAQVAAFFGSASPGSAEWSYRRFALHYAALAAGAGVDAFLIGSELASLTRVRSASGVYPAAQALATLAADAKAILGAGVKVSYSADWTEYGAHALDGGAELRFPLDPLWASAAVDFIGVDAYWPLSDWRDGSEHLDAQIARSIYDLDYLSARVGSGEDYDWWYADDAARAAQTRSPIMDGAFGKPWVFRAKDVAGWWSNAHHERVGGVELGLTAWIPQSKPVWLIETGCPAVDRGANAPNVFPDAKSSEGGIPPFSRGFRDDLMQARAIEATLSVLDPASPSYSAAVNPISSVYGGPMIDPIRAHVWAWDARPYPAFPMQSDVWTDAVDWETGHWLNGRLEALPLDRLVAALIDDARPDAPPIARPDIDGALDGYALDRLISPRAAIEPLSALFGFDAIICAGAIQFQNRAGAATMALTADDLAPDKDGALVTLTRAEDADLPHEIALTIADPFADYQTATILSRRLEGASRRQSQAETAVVMERGAGQRLLDIWLQDLWIAREAASFSVRPNLVALGIGDAVTLAIDGAPRLFLIDAIDDGDTRAMTARALEPSVFETVAPRLTRPAARPPAILGAPLVIVLDLASAIDTPVALQKIAVFANPWPGAMALWRASDAASFDYVGAIDQCAIVGSTLDALGPGPVGRIDPANSFRVSLSGGALAAVTDQQMFGGRNIAALRGADGQWEMFGFAEAELVAANTYRLSRLLRGLGGQESLASRAAPAGSNFVLLDGAVTPLVNGAASLGVATRWRVSPASRDAADPTAVECIATPGPLALTPYAPTQARATRGADGVMFSFLRRGRVGSDAWEPLDIPLGEDVEAYEIDVMKDGAVARTLKGSTQTIVYAAADESADFGAPCAAFDLRFYQLSASVGRGFPLQAHVVCKPRS